MTTVAAVTVTLYLTVYLVESRIVHPRADLNRIIGGRDAREAEFPFQVSFQDYDGVHFCGGSIINEHNIITAAHCSEFTSLDNIRVVAGLYRLSHWPAVKTTVWKIFLHAKYDAISGRNDIAIAAVRRSMPIGRRNLDKIPLASSPITAGSTITVTGWGFVKQSPPTLPDVLQAVEIVVIDLEKCRKLYKKHDSRSDSIKSGMMCAWNDGDGKDSCNGDSGGPAVAGGELVGLVSWGPTKCGSPDIPGVYTDVYYYRLWIDATVNRSMWLLSRLSASTMKISNVLQLVAIASVLRL